jgi:hypothetical protein
MIPRKAPSVCGYPIPICRAEVCAAPDCDAIIRRPERGAAERWCLEVIHLDLLSPLLSSGRSSIERRPPRLAGISLRGLAGPPLQRNIALTIRARRVPARTPSEWRSLCLLNDPPVRPFYNGTPWRPGLLPIPRARLFNCAFTIGSAASGHAAISYPSLLEPRSGQSTRRALRA